MGRPASADRIRITARLPYVLLPQSAGLPPGGPTRPNTGWVAQCGLFDVAGAGLTERSAVRNLRSALLVFIEACMDFGTWSGVVHDAGLSALELAGQSYWVGSTPPAAGPPPRVLEFTGYVDYPLGHREPLPAPEVRIPSAPDWLIRAEGLESGQRPRGRAPHAPTRSGGLARIGPMACDM
jgi:hypothetical protein